MFLLDVQALSHGSWTPWMSRDYWSLSDKVSPSCMQRDLTCTRMYAKVFICCEGIDHGQEYDLFEFQSACFNADKRLLPLRLIERNFHAQAP